MGLVAIGVMVSIPALLWYPFLGSPPPVCWPRAWQVVCLSQQNNGKCDKRETWNLLPGGHALPSAVGTPLPWDWRLASPAGCWDAWPIQPTAEKWPRKRVWLAEPSQHSQPDVGMSNAQMGQTHPGSSPRTVRRPVSWWTARHGYWFKSLNFGLGCHTQQLVTDKSVSFNISLSFSSQCPHVLFILATAISCPCLPHNLLVKSAFITISISNVSVIFCEQKSDTHFPT